MSSATTLIVARIRRAHGLRGEILVEPVTDRVEDVFIVGRELAIEAGPREREPRKVVIRSMRVFNDGVAIAFEGHENRSDVEGWNGRHLFASTADLEPPAADEVYLHDLVGMGVALENGNSIGTIAGYFEVGTGVLLEIAMPGRQDPVLFPYRLELVRGLDRAARVLTIDPPEGLLD